jgi:hypothetical protein
MQKVFLALVIFSLLAGCAIPVGGAPVAGATPTTGPFFIVTPVVGTVTVISMPPGKASLVLIASPEMSVSLGKVKIGDTGKALGVDASGKWMLVEIKQQTGWLKVQYLDYTIAQ